MGSRVSRSYFIHAKDLLESKKIPLWDFHIHTSYTDGKANVSQVFDKAIESGLDAIIFTEHSEIWRTSKKDWFADYCNDIEKNRTVNKGVINAFIGIEANAVSFNGDIDLTDDMLKRVEFILGAAHRYPGLENKKVHELKPNEAIDLEYKTLMGLASGKKIDAIAHIGATCTKYCTPFPKNLTREIINVAAKNNVAVEINPAYHKPLFNFINLCAEEDALITLGSNAHGFNDIGLVVRELKKCLK
jgi:putative hydrolase